MSCYAVSESGIRNRGVEVRQVNSFMRLAIANLSLVAFLLCGGCGSLVPSSRKENAATKVADNAENRSGFEMAGKMSPEFWPEVTASNIGKGTFSVRMPANYDVSVKSDNKGSAGSKDWFDYSFVSQIPLGVRIILIAIGLFMLLGFAWLLRKKSVAAKVATDIADRRVADMAAKADRAMASAIERNRTKAMTASDPKETAVAAIEVASLERERGILKASGAEVPVVPVTK